MTIAIVDSGISPLCISHKNITHTYKLIKKADSYMIQESQSEDVLGHGTAVADIIYRINSEVEFLSLNIYNEEIELDEDALLCALEFLAQSEIHIDIINISAGVTYITCYYRLKNICDKIREKGTIIISAFDNDGAISYPAALENVIGVDVTNNYTDRNSISLVENAIVNVVLPNTFYRVNWKNKKTIMKGASFASAKITGLISNVLCDVTNRSNLNNILSKVANRVIHVKKSKSDKKDICTLKIKKAILFPVNKESHALMRFSDKCQFDIVGVYDERVTGKVGRKLWGYEIKSLDSISWEDDFDTVVLSCYTELERLTKRQYSKEFVNLAQKYGKQIYSFEKIECCDTRLFYPEITPHIVPRYNLKKMHKISIPIVGVYGTSSKQGKFTLQLEIISMLKKMGYNVGHISSEPSGYLLGADYVFHFGYHAYVDMDLRDCIAILNERVWDIQLKKKDLLVVGCQSNSIHYDTSKIDDFAIYQYAFTLGTLPDLFVLCVNPHDEIDYICRTIGFLNAIDNGKVGAIVVFPIEAVENSSSVEYKMQNATRKKLNEVKHNLRQKLELPVFLLDDKSDLTKLCDIIIAYFSEANT